MERNDQNKLNILAYLRGELSVEEQATIESLMAQDSEFAANVEFQRTLRETLQDNKSEMTGTEFGWARLSKAIDEAHKNEIPEPANDSKSPGKIWQYAALLLACVVLGQAYFLGPKNASETNDKYFMAGDVETQPHFIFKPTTSVTLTVLTDALIQHEAIISMGPDTNGQYEVSFQTIEACDAAVKALNASGELFEATTDCE